MLIPDYHGLSPGVRQSNTLQFLLKKGLDNEKNNLLFYSAVYTGWM